MDFQIVTISVATQVLVMLILIITGYVLTKKDILTQNGSSEISTILLNVVTPCVLIRAYQIDFMKSEILNLLIAYLISVALHILYIIVAKLYFKGNKDPRKRTVNQLSAVFSNCGFMGIPLIEACFGSKGVFYGSSYLCVFNILAWTYCKYVFEKCDNVSTKPKLLNPGVIGVTVGLLFYFTQFKLPKFAYDSIGFIADLNTPLAMLVLGSFLARSGVIKSLKDPGVYTVSLFKLIFAPVILTICLWFLKTDPIMSICVVIGAACPVAAIIPIFANKYNSDYDYATNITVASTIISLITIPLICMFAGWII